MTVAVVSNLASDPGFEVRGVDVERPGELEVVHGVLVDALVGARWATPGDLSRWVVDGVGVGWVAVSGSELLGVAFAHRLAQDEVADLVGRWGDVLVGAWLVPGVAYLTAAVTRPVWRRRGVHRLLVERRIEWVRDTGGGDVVTVAWRSERDSSFSQLSDAGFVEVASIDSYWEGWSDTASLMRRVSPA